MGEQLFCKTLWNRCFCALAIASFQVLAREIQLGISVRDIRLLVKIDFAYIKLCFILKL